MGTVASGISPDTAIYVPYETGIKYITGTSISPTITVVAEDANQVDTVMTGVESALKESYPNTTFTISDAGSKMEAASASNETLTLLLISMAVIVFIVGGIGIMNMMLTNVTERIREIGIRRALGASRRDITAQFLAESSALCVTGGLLGVLIGYLLAWGLAIFATGSGILGELGASGQITPSFSIATVLLAFAVSVGIGVIFGFYPARRAAKLDPVECLRYQ